MSCLPLPEHGKFCDLNVPFESTASAGKKMSMLVQLGYEVVAFSKFMESSTNPTKKKKFDIPPPPPKIPLNSEMLHYFQSHNSSLMQFTRLTIELKQVDDLLKVRDALNCGTYDLIAVVPCNEQLFLQSCTELNIDIISLDCTTTFSYIPSFKLLSSANKRGICFEINYSPMIRDSSTRNCTISNAQKLSRVRKFSNLIMSSGSVNPMELRGPYDVANLNCLFGIPESSYIHTVSKHCRAALVHGFIRKTAKGAVYVQEMTLAEQYIAEKKLNSLIEAAEKKAKTVQETMKGTNVSQSVTPSVTPKSSSKKKKNRKSKKCKKADNSTNGSVQLVNVPNTNKIEIVATHSATPKSNKSEKKMKQNKNVAKKVTSEKDSKIDQTKSPEKKKAKKRKAENQSEKTGSKHART